MKTCLGPTVTDYDGILTNAVRAVSNLEACGAWGCRSSLELQKIVDRSQYEKSLNTKQRRATPLTICTRR
jgi:hypothetical protein